MPIVLPTKCSRFPQNPLLCSYRLRLLGRSDNLACCARRWQGGKTAKRGLRKRIQEFADFGRGAPVGHWGGRLLWQLADSQALLIAWKVLPPELVDATEAQYHAD